MSFYIKNHFQLIFTVKSFPINFYCKNNFQCIFMIKIIFNAFL